jgi:hypothetical protein
VWDLEVKWIKRDYEGTLKLLSADGDSELALPQHLWKIDDYRVRCLIRLKRTKDAIKEAEAIVKTKRGNAMLLVLAHASTGDCKQAMAAAEKLAQKPWLLTSCYNDAELGPILKSETFKQFREKFPEPKGAELDDDD